MCQCVLAASDVSEPSAETGFAVGADDVEESKSEADDIRSSASKSVSGA